MSRVLDRVLRPADGPAPVRPRLPALFEPGLDLMRTAAGPEQFPVPEAAGEGDHQDNPEIQNGSSRLPQADPDLAGAGAQAAEPDTPGTSAAAGRRPAAGSMRAAAQGGVPDRARHSTRMPGYPVRPANGTDAAGYSFVGPPGPGAAADPAAWRSAPGAGAGRRPSSSVWRSSQRSDRPAADTAGWRAAGPLAPGAGEGSPAGAASAWWPALRADSTEPGSARDPARAMMVPLSPRPPAPGRRPAAAPRLHLDARQHGADQHGVGWDSAGQHSAYQGSPSPSGVTQGGIRRGTAEPVVRISIGRVEIRADRADAPRPQRPAPRPRQPALDLAEYLRQRGGQR